MFVSLNAPQSRPCCIESWCPTNELSGMRLIWFCTEATSAYICAGTHTHTYAYMWHVWLAVSVRFQFITCQSVYPTLMLVKLIYEYLLIRVCVCVFWDSSVWRTLKCTCVLKAIDRMLACLKKVCNCYSCQLAGYVLTYHLTRTHIYIYRFINAYIDYKCL